ncbi:MAG: HEAT repeat domain-containing protein [Planctomycetota bacterium]
MLARLVLSFGFSVLSTAFAAAQLPPAADPDPTVDAFNYTWQHWWESFGEDYLEESGELRPRPWDHPAARHGREQAIAAVLPHLDSRDPRVREQAVLSLARMGYEPLLDRLTAPQVRAEAEPEQDALPGLEDLDALDDLADDAAPTSLLEDRDPGVRCAGWVALGLIDTVEARLVLLHDGPLSEQESAARVVGIGLMSVVDGVWRDALESVLGDPRQSIEVKRWAVWALNRHDRVANDDLLDAVLRRVPSTFAVSEVLLAERYAWRRGGSRWLADVIGYDRQVRDWAGYTALRRMPRGGAYGSSPMGLAMQTRVAASLTLIGQPPPQDPDRREALQDLLLARVSVATRDGTGQAHRGPDILALACHELDVYLGLELMYKLMGGYSVVPPLPPQIDVDGNLVDPDAPVQTEPQEIWYPFRGSRGFGAIGMGLMLRRVLPGSALHERAPIVLRRSEDQRVRRLYRRRLAEDITDFDEPMEYRAACALAIGLSNDPDAIPELTQRLSRLGAEDELVLGYGLLALAMLGEAEAADVARRYVARRGGVDNAWDIQGRRAALRAIAMVAERSPEAGRAALTGAWGKNVWVGLAIADTAAATGWYDVTPQVIESVRGDSDAWRLAGIMALGQMFDDRYPTPLDSIARGANYTLAFRPDKADLLRQRQVPIGPASGQGPATPREANPDDLPDGWPIRRFYIYSNPYLYDVLLRQ